MGKVTDPVAWCYMLIHIQWLRDLPTNDWTFKKGTAQLFHDAGSQTSIANIQRSLIESDHPCTHEHSRYGCLPSTNSDASVTEVNGEAQSSSLFSRKLRSTQSKHNKFVCGFLVMKHFPHISESRRFITYNNHNPLIYPLISTWDRHSPIKNRQLDCFCKYATDIGFIKDLIVFWRTLCRLHVCIDRLT